MILSFGDKATEEIFTTGKSAKFPPQILNRAKSKLTLLDAAETLATLSMIPANHFKELQGKHKGTYSLRINDQYRVTFTWNNGHAHNVKVEDYHDKI